MTKQSGSCGVGLCMLQVGQEAVFWEASGLVGQAVHWPASVPGHVNFIIAGCQ